MATRETIEQKNKRLEIKRITRNRTIYEYWRDIQDVIGEASKWPYIIRRYFWTKLNHKMRPIVVAFCFVNGLNPEVHYYSIA